MGKEVMVMDGGEEDEEGVRSMMISLPKMVLIRGDDEEPEEVLREQEAL